MCVHFKIPSHCHEKARRNNTEFLKDKSQRMVTYGYSSGGARAHILHRSENGKLLLVFKTVDRGDRASFLLLQVLSTLAILLISVKSVCCYVFKGEITSIYRPAVSFTWTFLSSNEEGSISSTSNIASNDSITFFSSWSCLLDEINE